MKRLLQDTHKKNSLPDHVRDLGINWTTITARGSSFGGLWEAAVKAMKLLYHKTLGNGGKLNPDEMHTVLRQIEAVFNSRPITSIADDVKDTEPLTPSRLLNGSKSSHLPIVADPTIDELYIGGLWEAAVKAMKLLYHKTLGNGGKLNPDEMHTVLRQIEAVFNSRPITSIADDVKDTEPLTPSRLLNGSKSSHLPIVADPTIDELTEDAR